jgi:hypothetical protein
MPVNRYYSSTAVDTVLTSPVGSGDTTINVDAVSGFPTSYPFTLALGFDGSNEELVNIVGASGTTLKIGVVAGAESTDGRGVDGTSATSHAVGEVVKHVISARDMREAQEHIANTSNPHGIADVSALLTTSSTIGASQLGSNAVTTAKIADSNVTTAKIADAAITTAKIADGAVATGDIADGAVTSAKIADGTIVNADINSSAAIAQSKISGLTSALDAKLDASATAVDASKIDGRTVFVQEATPTANATGDIWFQVTGL